MLLSITNLTASPLEFQDPTGNSTFKVKVGASTTKSDVEITAAEYEAIEPQLEQQKTASKITFFVKRDPGTFADDVPYNIRTATTSPVTVAADDEVIYCNLVATAVVSVVLPVAAPIGHEVVVIDGKGDAGTRNITTTVASAGTINGGASHVISINKGGARFLKVAATEWRSQELTAQAAAPTGAAGGDLTGTYPNPTIGADKVTEAQLNDTVAGVAQTLVGAGVVDITHRTTKLTSSAGAQAITLANGSRVGQRKTIIHAVDGGSMVLTPANPAVFATIVFTAVRDWAELEWNGTTWDLVAFGGCTFT